MTDSREQICLCNLSSASFPSDATRNSDRNKKGRRQTSATIRREDYASPELEPDLPSSDRKPAPSGEIKIFEPTLVDILLGWGKPLQGHPGNQYMIELVKGCMDTYNGADRRGKRSCIESIVESARGAGGRFSDRVVHYEEYWVEVSYALAYKKVGHAFRTQRVKDRKRATIAGCT